MTSTNKTLKGVVLKLCVVFAIAFVIEGSAYLYHLHTLKGRAIPSALFLTIQDYRSKCVQNAQPNKPAVQLSRPYALVYVGGLDGSVAALGTFRGSLHNNIEDATSSPVDSVADIKTLILVKDREIGRASYGRPDNLTGGVVSADHTYYRYEYCLCAFDLNSGTLQAYGSLEDNPFKAEYRDSGPGNLASSVFTAWANSVTRAPSVDVAH